MPGNEQLDLAGNRVPAGTAAYPGPVTGGRRGVKAKTLKKLLKKAGLKTSGKKSTLRARARKARLIRGGYLEGQSHVEGAEVAAPVGGSSRRRSVFRKFW